MGNPWWRWSCKLCLEALLAAVEEGMEHQGSPCRQAGGNSVGCAGSVLIQQHPGNYWAVPETELYPHGEWQSLRNFKPYLELSNVFQMWQHNVVSFVAEGPDTVRSLSFCRCQRSLQFSNSAVGAWCWSFVLSCRFSPASSWADPRNRLGVHCVQCWMRLPALHMGQLLVLGMLVAGSWKVIKALL